MKDSIDIMIDFSFKVYLTLFLTFGAAIEGNRGGINFK